MSGLDALLGPRKPQWHAPNQSSEEARRHAEEFQPRPTDLFILTAPKTGTTWLQQVCHQIRSGGHEDFEDIYQGWEPRLFKTHQALSAINRGGKVMCTVRRPEAVLKSWYNFLRNKQVPPVVAAGDVNTFAKLPAFFAENMRFGATLWQYYREFWLCRNDPNVLVLVFEDLQADLAAHIPLIARFMGVPVTDETVALVATRSSKEYMMNHGSQFDETWTYARLQEVGTIVDASSFTPAPRVTEGHTDVISEATVSYLEGRWRDDVEAPTGVASYDAMCRDLRQAVSDRFATADG